MKNITIFYAVVNGVQKKKFSKPEGSVMNSTWNNFNKYAKARGFNEIVEDGKYFGSMAWKNDKNEIMELIKP
jgi:hypothetical protein